MYYVTIIVIRIQIGSRQYEWYHDMLTSKISKHDVRINALIVDGIG